jgi:hypothetical protein
MIGKQLIGKKVYELTQAQNGWLDERWPAVDSDGTIREVYDADATPDGCMMIDWEWDGEKFTYEETDGDHGFMAILEN